MKTVHYTLVLFFLVFNQILSYAQAPGYLGKRTTLEVSGTVQPAFLNPNKNGSSFEGTNLFAENKTLVWNSILSINANYAINRINSIGIKYHRSTTGTIFDHYTPNSNYVTTLSKINIQRIGLTYSIFKMTKGSLSPIGASFYVSLGGAFMNSSEMTTRDYRQEISPLTELYPNLKTNVSAMELGIGWLKRWLIIENVYIKTGFQFNALVKTGGLSFYGNQASYSDYEEDPIRSTYETAVLYRTLMHNLINFEIGVGAVLF